MKNKLHEFSTSTTNKLDSGLNQVPIIYDGRPWSNYVKTSSWEREPNKRYHK